jgi:catechol 2,3-dioxygenase-like lactoylglutathione lyase family enzyme
MIGYITIGAADIERAKTFYDSVLGTIGWKQFADYGDPVGYAQNETGEGQTIWICKPFDGAPATASWLVSMPKPSNRFTRFTTPP